MEDITTSLVQEARQFAAMQLAATARLPYHNIEMLLRALGSLEILAAGENLPEEEAETAGLAVCLYFTGFREIAAESKEEYFEKAKQNCLPAAKKWLKENGYSPKKTNCIISELEHLFYPGQPITTAGRVAADALTADWASENGEKYAEDLFKELAGKANIRFENMAGERLQWLYHHRYFTQYGKATLEAGKIHTLEKLEKQLKAAEREADIFLKKELHLDADELKDLKKKMKALKGRDDKSFMDMLRATSRNHYTLNQMVDRKARIIIWVNAFVLSFIVNRMLEQQPLVDWRFYLLILPSITGLLSVFYAVLSIRPERSHGKLSSEDIRHSRGNPLFFGNFQTLPPGEYENAMLEMVNDREFVYRAMIQDIFYLGQILRQKSNYLYVSLYIFLGGISLTLLLTILLRLLQIG